MADSFTYWMEYLFLSPDEEAWVTGFHQLLERWQLEDCRKLLTAAKRRADEHPRWIPRIQACEGRLWLHKGDWERAESAYRAALDVLDDEEVRELFHLSADLGLLHRLRGDVKKAIHNHQLCLELAAEHQWRDEEAECHIQLGLDYEMMGDLRRAEHHLLEAERLYRQLGDALQLAITRKSLALVVIGLHQFEHAEALLIEALPMLETGTETLHAAHAYGNLGNLAVHRDDYQKARGYYEQAMGRFQALGAVLEMCGILNNLAGIAYYEGDFDEARDYYDESLKRARDLGSVNDERNTLINLSLLHLNQREYRAAAQTCRDALRLSWKLGDRRAALRLLRRLMFLRLILLLKRV